MLLIFHAAGHSNFEKSCHIYLKEMFGLKSKVEADKFRSVTELGFLIYGEIIKSDVAPGLKW